MAIDFPASPTIGQTHPNPPVDGVPVYQWDGTSWNAVASVPESNTYVKRVGDTMSGHLTLPTGPAAANAVRKDYVDAALAGVDLSSKVSKAGDTMVGPLVLPADPTLALQAAPKQYVDAVRVYAAPLDVLAYSGIQINGAFEVAQTATTTTLHDTEFCDGWRLYVLGPGVQAFTQPLTTYVPGLPGFVYIITLTAKPVLAPGDYSLMVHRIEGYRMARLGWGTAGAKPITIGFWSSHTPPGVYSVSVTNAAQNRFYGVAYTHAVADVLQYNVVTIPGCPDGVWNTTNGTGISLHFAQACGSTYITTPNVWANGAFLGVTGQVNGCAATTPSNLIRILGVGVFPGIYAPTAAQSPNIVRPFVNELLLCQRYYENGKCATLGGGSVGEYVGNSVYFKVTKRAVPACTAVDAGSSNLGAVITTDTLTLNQMRVYSTTAGGASHLLADWTASARL